MNLNALYVIIIRYFFIMLTLLLLSGLWMFWEHTLLTVEGVMKHYEPKSFFGLLETVSPHLFGMGMVVFILTHFYAVVRDIDQRRGWLFGLFSLVLVANFSEFFIGGLFFSLVKLISTVLMVGISLYLMGSLIRFSK